MSSIPRVGSTTSLAIIPEVKELIERERKFAKDIGPEYGFDLTKIRMHYNHRRELRR